jgi:glutamyl/glutaminyl-tRNA synthetase
MADTDFLPSRPVQIYFRAAMRAGQNAVIPDFVEVVYGSLLGWESAVKLKKRHLYTTSLYIN